MVGVDGVVVIVAIRGMEVGFGCIAEAGFVFSLAGHEARHWSDGGGNLEVFEFVREYFSSSICPSIFSIF